MKRVILLSVLLSSLALARYYEFDLEKVSDPFAQESYGIPQDHEVDLANVKVPWGLIGEAGWVQIGYEKDERLRIILQTRTSLQENQRFQYGRAVFSNIIASGNHPTINRP